MTQTANNYATVLLELGVTREAVDETKEILSDPGSAEEFKKPGCVKTGQT